VIAQFTGTNGGLRARIGMLLTVAPYYGPIIALGQVFQLTSIAIGTSSSPTNPSVQMGIDQVPTITAVNITVAT